MRKGVRSRQGGKSQRAKTSTMKTPTPVRLHSYVRQLSDFVSLYMIPVFLKIKTNLEAQKGGSAALEGAGFILDRCLYIYQIWVS